MQKFVLILALYVSSSLALPAYAGLMGDTIDLSFNAGEFTEVSAPNRTPSYVVGAGTEITGTSDGVTIGPTLENFFFIGESIDFLDEAVEIVLNGFVEGTITVSGIADTLIGATEAAGDANDIIDSVTFIDANSFSFRLSAPFSLASASSARINLSFAPTPVPEPSTLGLLFLGMGSILLLRRKTG